MSLWAARWHQTRGPIFYKIALVFTLLALIIYAHAISIVINMKYDKFGYLKWILLFWVTSTYFPINHLSYLRLLTCSRGRDGKSGGLKNRLISYVKPFLKLVLLFLIQVITGEYIIISDPMISRQFSNLRYFVKLCVVSPGFTLRLYFNVLLSNTPWLFKVVNRALSSSQMCLNPPSWTDALRMRWFRHYSAPIRWQCIRG
jgi:hypothetical protein